MLRPFIRCRYITPSLRPIQLRCIVLIGSGQSNFSRLFSNLSGYELSSPVFFLFTFSFLLFPVILKNHCSRFFCITLWPQRSHWPSITFSLAKTVWQEGHQFTGACFL